MSGIESASLKELRDEAVTSLRTIKGRRIRAEVVSALPSPAVPSSIGVRHAHDEPGRADVTDWRKEREHRPVDPGHCAVDRLCDRWLDLNRAARCRGHRPRGSVGGRPLVGVWVT